MGADIRLGQLAEVSIIKNDQFRLPKNTSTPVIMIGAGTGVAPFRGFIQVLTVEAQQCRQAMLFFGCRNQKDYLYRSELESAPVELHVAFSRPDTTLVSSSNNSKKKQYVQDSLWENRDRVWQLMKEGAHIFVCGDGRYMAKCVDQTLFRITVECGSMNENDAIEHFEQLEKTGDYVQDVWCD